MESSQGPDKTVTVVVVSETVDGIAPADSVNMNSTNMGNITVTDAPNELLLPEYLHIYTTFFNVVIFLTGFIGNMMVIQVVTRMRAMRNRMNYFLLSLSVADLLVLTVCQPVALMVFYTGERWVLGEFMCKLVPFLEHGTVHTSALTLVAIGMERYNSVNGPLRDLRQQVQSRTWPAITAIWSVGFIMSLPFVFLTQLQKVEFYDGSVDFSCRTLADPPLGTAYICVLFVLFFVIPMLLLVFMYSSIIRKLFLLTNQAPTTSDRAGLFSFSSSRTSRSSRASSNRSLRSCRICDKFQNKTVQVRRRVAVMMIVIVCLFFLTMLPFKIFGLWQVMVDSTELEKMGFVTYYNVLTTCRLITYVNSAGNPVIYCLLSPKFRRAFKQLLPCSAARS